MFSIIAGSEKDCIVKGSGGGEKTEHRLPQIKRADDKLGLDRVPTQPGNREKTGTFAKAIHSLENPGKIAQIAKKKKKKKNRENPGRFNSSNRIP